MSAVARIGGFAASLAVIFAAAAFAGSKIDTGVDEEGPAHQGMESGDAHEGGPTTGAVGAAVPGLAAAEGSYRLVPERTRHESSPNARYRFRVVDEDGETVRDFDVEHERRMHLIVVRRDFAEFQHLHPRQLEDGAWEADVDLSRGGVYRAFADFATSGQSLTLATDLFAPGRFDPISLPPPATTDRVGEGYEVALDSAAPRSGGTHSVEFKVLRNGQPVDSVEPYLGADGHLVALREHDLGFLHTHPEGEPGGPGPIKFAVEYPSAGRYRLFLQFKHRGEVHTAAFTQDVSRTGPVREEAGHGGH